MESKKIVFFSIILLIIGIAVFISDKITIVGDVASPGGIYNSNCISVDTASGIIYTDFQSSVHRFGWFTKLLVDKFIVPTNPSALYVSPDRIAWIANESLDYVSCINLFTGIETRFGTGIMPCSMVYDGRYLWVVNKGSNTVSSIETNGGYVKPPVEVGDLPVSIAFDGGNTLFVALAGEKAIATLNIIREGEVTSKIKVADDLNYPVKVFFDEAHLWVLCQGGLVQRVIRRPLKDKKQQFDVKTAFRMTENVIYTDIFVDINKILIGNTQGTVTVLNKTGGDYFILQRISIPNSIIKSIFVDDFTDYYILSTSTEKEQTKATLRKYQYKSETLPFIFTPS